jgi:hypothetical protein
MRPLIRILVFIALLGGFWALGGFVSPQVSPQVSVKQDPRPIWALAIVLYIVGAGVAVWADKTIGVLQPVSLRPLYVILGIALMLLALLPTLGRLAAPSPRPSPPSSATPGSGSGL